MMDIFTTITDSYDYSRELALSLSLFREMMPEDSRLTIIKRGNSDPAEVLASSVAESMESRRLSEPVLIVKEPAMLMGQNCISEMQKALDSFPYPDCILPSDIRGFRPGIPADYMTLRSFEKFVSQLQQDSGIMPYDGREVFMFLIREEALRDAGAIRDIFSIPGIIKDRTAISTGAYIHPFFHYYEEKREEVIPLIPETVRSVLDIGCSRGGFGSALKAERSCRVVGIEQNSVEGDKARQILDRVIIGDALETDPGEHFDCVICLDTLEHFTDPSLILKKIHDDFLAEKGYILVTVPNVGHWSIVADLLAGRWDYLPVGIQCNTHMRFYTLHSIKQLLEKNGFSLVRTCSFPVPMPESFHNLMDEFIRKGEDVDIRSLEAVSHLVLAQRKTDPNTQ